ncbi:MAG: nuclear transport factor 2 family protein [Cruoricaptor ignavus]|nr:nuclear transport factor 2 family protein [Cruoricaptor ignavus]
MRNRVLVATILLMSFFIGKFYAQQGKGFYENVQKKHINTLLDNLNDYAAKADFKNYFELFQEESVFIGTDATEIWTKKEFMDYAKPHFDKGKAWSFKSIKRNIYFSKDGTYAWFDELLDTQMKICRGSGVLERVGNRWKIKQYVLSMTVPNNVSNEVIQIKTPTEDAYIKELTRE